MGKNTEQVFRELRDDLLLYGELKLELVKLNAYERIGKIIAILSYGLLLFGVLFMTVQFILLTLGFFLSNWFNSTTIGFSIIVAIYFVQVALIYIFRKPIRLKVMNVIISSLNNDQKHDMVINSKENDDSSSKTFDAN